MHAHPSGVPVWGSRVVIIQLGKALFQHKPKQDKHASLEKARIKQKRFFSQKALFLERAQKKHTLEDPGMIDWEPSMF